MIWTIGELTTWLTPRGFIAAAYVLVLAALCTYGAHRFLLVCAFRRTRGQTLPLHGKFEDLPLVTAQLPMYNEPYVAQRVIEAACAIDYPRDKLQIQVLDDSTDETAAIARRCCLRLADAGHDVQYIRRLDRSGYKAGALEQGMQSARGELIAVFDADFIPPRDFLTRTIDYFTDPKVGMVQACWDHLNADSSMLTRCEAVMLDGHFLIEHAARNRSGRWMNFNGTAGIWRRSAIDDAGGWQHETLTEDMDLSYRAQLAGWRFIYLPDLQCPAELPPRIDGFKTQQNRWAKGAIQTARKLLPRILRSSASLGVKTEAVFHLTAPLAYPLLVLLGLLLGPVLWLNIRPLENGLSADAFGWLPFALGTLSVAAFYAQGQMARGHSVWRAVAMAPAAMSLGVGISLSNSIGVIGALTGRGSGFVRTPKYHAVGDDVSWRANGFNTSADRGLGLSLLELLMGVYMTGCTALCLRSAGGALGAPFVALFAAGFLWVGASSLLTFAAARRQPVSCAAAGIS